VTGSAAFGGGDLEGGRPHHDLAAKAVEDDDVAGAHGVGRREVARDEDVLVE